MQNISERQRATELQLAELAALIKALDARLPAQTATAQEAARRENEVTPEMLVVIAAAVTAFLGKKVRIRSAKLLIPPPREAASAWAQQGRVLIHASHRLR
jgi:methylmalonyl-CoA carboxyltransferase large subunit